MTDHEASLPKTSVSGYSRLVGPVAAHIAFVMELTLVPLLLPALGVDFSLSVGTLAWVFNAYSIAVAAGVLIGGVLGDAFRTDRIFAVGVATFACGSLLVAWSSGLETLIVGRVLQGFGAGVFSPLIPILLTRLASDKPGRALILWGSIAGYIAAFAPLIYSTTLDGTYWRFAFVVLAAQASVALWILRGSNDGSCESTTARPVVDYTSILSASKLWLVFAYVFCTYGAITFFLFRLPVWLSGNAVETGQIGLILSAMWLTFSAVSTLLRNKVDQDYVGAIMVAAPILIAVGLVLSLNQNTGLLIIASIFVGSGLAYSNAPSTQMILRYAPNGLSAISTCLDITFARIGGFVTVALLANFGLPIAAPVLTILCIAAVFCSVLVCPPALRGA